MTDTVNNIMKEWENFINKNREGDTEDSYKRDILLHEVEPRFKHFRPPFSIKIFKWEISMMWAYRITKATLLKDCYPVGMSISNDDNEIKLDFSCKAYRNDAIDKAADEISSRIENMRKNENDKGDIFTYNFNNECDLLEWNEAENASDTQYPSCSKCHRYEICKEYYKNKAKEDN